MRSRSLFALAAGLSLLLGACSPSGGDDGQITVIASFPLIAEFAERVAGDDARVTSLIPLGVDEHSYSPSPAAAREVARADLVLVNGYALESTLLGLIANNVREGVPVVPVSRGLEPLDDHHDHDHDHDHDEDEHDHEEDHEDEHADEHEDEHLDDVVEGLDPLVTAEGDPHFWLDVANAIGYVHVIRDALIEVDPDRRDGYTERADALVAELEALDAEVRETLAAVPEADRTIVVFHNAYEYFAHAYGFEVIESVAPANPNQATDAQTIAEIVRTVREAGVAAIYREPQFSGQVMDAIAAETGAQVLTLYSIPAEGAETYADLMRANAEALAAGLGAR